MKDNSSSQGVGGDRKQENKMKELDKNTHGVVTDENAVDALSEQLANAVAPEGVPESAKDADLDKKELEEEQLGDSGELALNGEDAIVLADAGSSVSAEAAGGGGASADDTGAGGTFYNNGELTTAGLWAIAGGVAVAGAVAAGGGGGGGGGGGNPTPVAVDDTATAVEGGGAVAGSVASNDTDNAEDLGNLAFTLAPGQAPVAGFVLLANGAYAFDPTNTAYNYLAAGETANIAINYSVSDGNSADTGVLTITITGTNDAPTFAGAAVASGAEDGTISGSVTATDLDLSDVLTYAAGTTAPANGTVTVNANGTFAYVPNADFNGSDSFTVTVSDGNGGSATQTVNVTVTPVNDAPVATDDAAAATEGATVIAGTVASNDVDVDGNTLSYALASGQVPVAGFALNSDGDYTFDPSNAAYNYLAAGETLDVLVNYKVSDGSAQDTGVLTITVTGTNDAPVFAGAATASGAEDSTISGSVTATDVDLSDVLTYAAGATAPANGTVTVNANGTFSYVPNANFNGSDSFTVTVSDSNGGSATQTVNVTVTPVNDAPVAVNDSNTATEGGAVVAGTVASNDSDVDGDSLSYGLASTQAPVAGFTLNANGGYTFDPTNAAYDSIAAGTVQTITVAYTVSDGVLSANAELTITIQGTNDAPVFVGAATASGAEDGVISGSVVATDVDTGDVLTYSAGATAPANGSVTVNADGTFTYTPNADYNGPDSFSVLVTDAGGLTAEQTVNVTVTPVNDAPEFASPTKAVTTDEDVVLNGSVSATDVDGDTLTYTLETGASNGTVSVDSNGNFVYTPVGNFNGADSFVVSAKDPAGLTTLQTVNVTISPVNDAPTYAVATQSVNVLENVLPSTVVATATATDIDGDSITYTLTGPDAALFTIDPVTGQIRFVASPDFETQNSNAGTNTYSVTAVATDNGVPVLNGSQAISINVTDLNEAFSPAVDTIGGTANDDVFFARNNDLNSGDNLNALGGNDTVQHSLDGALTAANTVRNFSGFTFLNTETLSVTNDSGHTVSYDLSTTSAVANGTINTLEVNNATSDVAFNNQGEIADTDADGFNEFNLSVNNLTAGVDIALDISNADAAGNDELNLNLTDSDEDGVDINTLSLTAASNTAPNGGNAGPGVDLDANLNPGIDQATASGIEMVNITTVGSPNSIRINDLNTPGSTVLNIAATVDLTIGDTDQNILGAIANVQVDNADNANFDGFEYALSSSIAMVDGSSSNGNLAFSTEANDAGADILLGSGNDTVFTGTGRDTISGGAGNDTIIADDDGNEADHVSIGADSIDGGAGNDFIQAGNGNNTVDGGIGNDTITSGANQDSIDGGEGDDSINAGNGNNTVNGGLGNDLVTVGTGNDLVNGDEGNDVIDITAGGNDTVNGGDGNDVINAGASLTSGYTEFTNPGQGVGDQIDGGDNATALSFTTNNANGAHTVTGGDVLNISESGDANELDSVRNVEQINLTGGAFTTQVNDGSWFDTDTTSSTVINAEGLAGSLVFNGNDGGVGAADGPAAAVNSDDGVLSRSITILGSSSNDRVNTGSGNDYVDGNAGDDTIATGAGNDTVEGGTGSENVVLDFGNDVYIARDFNNGDDRVGGGVINANTGADLDGSDIIDGRGGFDTILLINEDEGNVVPAGVENAQLGAQILGIEQITVVDDDDAVNGDVVDIEFLAAYGSFSQLSIIVDGSQLDANETLIVRTNLQDNDGDIFTESFDIRGGQGDDQFWMGDHFSSKDTLDGNGGIDAIYTDVLTVDTDFTNSSDLEQLIMTDTGGDGDIAILGVNAQAAGIVSAFGAGFDDSINASGYTADIYLQGNAGNDTLIGGAGNDNILGGAGNDSLVGDNGDDTLSGGAGNDTMLGGAGDDSFFQGEGTDSMVGGAGDNTYSVYANELDAADTIIGGANADTVLLINDSNGLTAGGQAAVNATVNLDNVTGVENFRTIDFDQTNVNPFNFNLTFQGGNVTTQTLINVDASGLTDNDGDALNVTIAGTVDQDYKFNITGGEGNDSVTDQGAALPNDIVFSGGLGMDTLFIDGTDLGTTVTMDGGAGNDVINVTSGAVTDDSFVSVTSVEILTAGAALNAQLGANAAAAGLMTINGSAGNDMAVLDAAFNQSTLTVNLSPIFGPADPNNQAASGGSDNFNASATNTAVTFRAQAADITAADALLGGTTVNDVLQLQADNGTADLDGVRNVERIEVLEGFNAADDANITINVTDNTFGGIGTLTIDGTALNDTLFGGAAATEGDLVVTGGTVGAGNNFSILAGTGDDTITTGAGDDFIDVGEGNDVVSSGAGNDTIVNLGGDNSIDAGADDDSITLADGNNTVDAGTGNDTVFVGDGDNSIVAGTGNDNVTAGNGDNTIFGGAGTDTILVGNGDNYIDAGTENDTVTAGTGADTITGGAGADSLTGGTGFDQFRYVNLSDSQGLVRDTITDFEAGVDQIALETTMLFTGLSSSPINPGNNPTSSTPGMGQLSFAGNAVNFSDAQGAISTTADDGIADYVLEQANGGQVAKLWIDINDDGILNGLDVQILLPGVTALTGNELLAIDTLPPTVTPVVATIAEDRLLSTTTASPNLAAGVLDGSDNDGTPVTYILTGTNAGGVETVVGTFGTLTIDTVTGAYTYTKNAAAIEALDDGETGQDVFNFQVMDDVGLTTDSTITVDVSGADDNPAFTSAAVAASITEDVLATTEVEVATSGTLTASDVDVETLTFGIQGGAAIPLTDNVELADTYGTLVVNTVTGAYTYTQDAAAVEAVAAGETPQDVFTVTVSDGDDADITQAFTVTINGANDAPVISLGVLDTDTAALNEDLANIGVAANGTLTVTDVDTSDNVNNVVALTGTAGTYTGPAIAGTAGMMLVTAGPLAADTPAGSSIVWNFNSGAENFNALAAGETLVLTYTVTSTDTAAANEANDTHDIVVTITGTNDAPNLSVAAGDSAVAALNESNAALLANGTLTAVDPDVSDNVTAAIDSLVTGGSYAGPLPAGLLAMMTVVPAGVGAVAADPGALNNVTWNFNSGAETFDFLAAGETIVLNYELSVSDGTLSENEVVTVVITGTNDAPDVAVVAANGDSAAGAVLETDAANLTVSDTLTVTDIDDSDTVTAAVTAVAINAASTYDDATYGNASALADLLTMMSVTAGPVNADTPAGDPLTWTFNSGSGASPSAFDFLADGETLVLDYTITVTDDSGAANNTDTQVVSITITGSNDAPDVAVVVANGDSAVGAVLETDAANLTVSDTLTVTDIDDSDTVTAAVTAVAINAASTYDDATYGNATAIADLLGMMSVTAGPVNADTAAGDPLTWTFNSGNGASPSAFDFLADGETLVLDYTITVTDDSGIVANNTDTQVVSITITGSNDAPDVAVVVANGDSAAGAVLETNVANLTVSDTLTVTDIDDSDTVTAAVTAVAISAASTYDDATYGNATAIADLLGMMSVTAGAVNADTPAGNPLTWTFNSGNGASPSAFDFLAAGETLVLDYTITVTDDSGIAASNTDTQVVSITITGSNDAPDVAVVVANGDSAAGAVLETDAANLTVSDTLTVADIDDSDTVTAAVTAVAINAASTYDDATYGNVTAFADLLGMMSVTAGPVNADTPAGNPLTWTFNSGNGASPSAFDFLADGETLVLDYTITVTDDSGIVASNTDTQVVSITITGSNDAPDVAVVVANGDSAVGAVLETDAANLTVSDTLTVTDIDDSDTVTAAVTAVAINAASTYDDATYGNASALADLLTMMSVTAGPVNADTPAGNPLTWTFNSGNGASPSAFDFLADGETLVLDYTITVTDDSGIVANNTDTQVVSITITGSNDAPDVAVVVANGDSAAGAVLETDAANLTVSDTLTVTDIDDSDTVTAAVTAVAINAASTYDDATYGNATAIADLLGMMSVTAGAVNADTPAGNPLTWTFNSGNGASPSAFDFLAAGETLVLDYTITVTDDSGIAASNTDTQVVSITITGTNDAPTLAIQSADETSITLLAVDPDDNETISLQTAINGDSALNNGADTVFNVLAQGGVVITQLIVEDVALATGNANATLFQGTDNLVGDNIGAPAAGNAGYYYGFGGGDTMTGGALDDTFFGGDGADSLSGAGGADLINGEAGDDILTGGEGADTLNGGADNDTFNLADTDDAIDVVEIAFGGEGQDVINDFASEDIIDFTGISDTLSAGFRTQGTYNGTIVNTTTVNTGVIVFDTDDAVPASFAAADIAAFLADHNAGAGVDNLVFDDAGEVAYLAISNGVDTGLFRISESDSLGDGGVIDAGEITQIATLTAVGNANVLTSDNFADFA